MNRGQSHSLESVWTEREDVIYPKLFGSVSRGIFVLSIEMFAQTFGQSEVDPRWLTHGVIEFAPTASRASWLYVTSGTSNPWEVAPEDYPRQEYSGMGTELVLESDSQAEWPIVALQQLLAYNILLAHGRFGDIEALDYGARVPLGGPVDGRSETLLRFLVVTRASHYAASFQLPSGKVDLLHLVGVTESERDFAKVSSTHNLIELLAARGAGSVTDPRRTAVI